MTEVSVIRSIIGLVVVLFIGSVVGGVLASLADMYALEIVRGTVLGPDDPDTALAWTAVGVVATESVRRWLL